MSDKHTCPRRLENYNSEQDKDTWRVGTSFAGEEDNTDLTNCSYCGSIHPDQFMQKLAEGWFLNPTDKNYKAYLGKPIEPYKLLDSIEIDNKDVGKFYFQHLSVEQRRTLIDLVNSTSIKIGYPGYLYSGLFFAVEVAS